MDQKTLRILEFHKIRQQLAAHTAFALGSERALWLEPSADIDTIEKRQGETAEALILIDREGGLPLGGVRDIRQPLRKAEMGSTLSPEDLLEIASTLYGTGKARRFLMEKTGDSSQLRELAQRLEPAVSLRERIEGSIGDDGEVLDSASETLRSIRNRMRSLQGRIRERLESIIHSSRYQKVLQDPIITLRNGRYVVPVKTEFKGALPGIVHDQSGSGATLFVEPAAVVEINNQLRQLEAEEAEEIERILRQLTLAVSGKVKELLVSVETLGRLDFIFAKAYLAASQEATRPRLRTDGYLDMREGRHPLLKGEVVPLDIWLGKEFTVLVITGPNTGGKTVALKTLGLLTLMAQAGLHIPAQKGTEINVFSRVYADIGDEQSIEQNLSTFSSHMANIVRIMDEADSNSLVLLDELGAGTDPTEGATLAMALLQWFHKQGCRTVATTHYSELKAFAYMTEGLENASVQFDVETLRPTYKLEIGLPGRSNAFAIAGRLGLRDEVIDLARAHLTQEDIRIDDMIQDMEENRRRAIHERIVAERLRAHVESTREEYERRLAGMEEAKDAILAAARQEARELLSRAKSDADELLGQLRNADRVQRESVATEVRSLLESKREALVEARPEKPPEPLPIQLEKMVPGTPVYLSKLKQKGRILDLTASGDALVQVGALRVTLPAQELTVTEEQPIATGSRENIGLRTSKASVISSELDLRGMTVEEALGKVDKYLDDALLAGLARCRIIHGKGTGALRSAIRSQLETHPQVKAYRWGEPGEGGDGVTVAELG
ncbi:MAG: endonuclease MutS2 [Firmicutes bacterium]|nr:endonuclease MutS2 [Bacillota bacterium]